MDIDPTIRYGCDALGNLSPMLSYFKESFNRIFLLRNEATEIRYFLDDINDYSKTLSITEILRICHRQIGWELSFLLAYWLTQNLQKAWLIGNDNLDISEFLTAYFFVEHPAGIARQKPATYIGKYGMFFEPQMIRGRLSNLFVLKYQTEKEVHYILNLE